MIEKHGEAVVDFDVVIKKNPKNAHAYFRRAFSLKALKVSRLTSSLNCDIVSINSCLVLLLLQRYAEAVEDFEKARTLDPMNPALVVNYKKL